MPVLFLAVGLVGFCLGIASVMFVLAMEFVPLQIREVMTGALSALNALSLFVAASTMHLLFNAIGPSGTFWLYATCSILLVVFVQIAVPETKGQSLEAIERKLTQVNGAVEQSSDEGKLGVV
jgi:predicted MFS family arabinose efflux permease